MPRDGTASSTVAQTLYVRNLDDGLVAELRRRAELHGRSVEAEHREILRHALATEVEPDFHTLAAALHKLTAGRTRLQSCCCTKAATNGDGPNNRRQRYTASAER
jgi:antitoxin FitA